jgi:predicted ATPase/DNA-binding CsgD family transcriptional regulator
VERGTRPAKSNKIPFQATPFVGREKELKAVAALLRQPEGRLVTLVGPGGIGKTRLSLQVALELIPHYESGAWVVELACIDDPALLSQGVASVLGLREEADRPLLEDLIAHLQSKHLLLVLDNCEHLHGACAQLVHELLASCPKVHILVTSREALHIAGEATWPVPPLELPDLANLAPPEDLLRYEAVRLFVDRAQRVFPLFSITEENASAIAEVCHRLDGLPLSIELAAAWVRMLSVSQIADRLDDRLALLAGTDQTAPARQRTLEAALDWSYDLLTGQEQVLFQRLSVFAGGFSLQAAETVCSGNGLEPEEILDLLSRLVDKSLVMVERKQGQERRCRLLATVRQYATMHLEAAGDQAHWRDRHLGWCLALAERARPDLWGAAGRASFVRLDSEEDNIRAALQWSIQSGAADESLRLAAALGWHWYVRAHLHQGRYWLKQALATSEGAASASRASALNAAGALAVLQNDHERATELLQEAVRLDCASRCSRVAAWSLQELGLAAHYGGRYARAEERFAESMSLFREMGDDAGIASVLLNQGITAHYQGDDARAAALLQESLSSLLAAGDAMGTARAMHGLGLVARHQGDLDRAQASFQEALQIAHERGARLEVALCLEGLAGLASQRTEAQRGARLFGAAERLYEVIGTDLPTGHRTDHERDTGALRAQMTEPTFTETWSAGRELDLEKAVAYALEEEDRNGATQSRRARPLTELQMAKQRYGGLTAREREVAALVTQGLGNSAIAAELFVTVRTVEAHITHILRKLGYSSRAQIAAWGIDRGLAGAPQTLEERMSA